MSRGVVTSADGFSAALGDILADVERAAVSSMKPALKRTGKQGKEIVRENAASLPINQGGATTQRYIAGFTYRVQGDGIETHMAIGNRDVPGLVHLLEKGHAKMGGGRVQGYDHISKSAQKIFDIAVDELDKEVAKRL